VLIVSYDIFKLFETNFTQTFEWRQIAS